MTTRVRSPHRLLPAISISIDSGRWSRMPGGPSIGLWRMLGGRCRSGGRSIESWWMRRARGRGRWRATRKSSGDSRPVIWWTCRRSRGGFFRTRSIVWHRVACWFIRRVRWSRRRIGRLWRVFWGSGRGFGRLIGWTVCRGETRGMGSSPARLLEQRRRADLTGPFWGRPEACPSGPAVPHRPLNGLEQRSKMGRGARLRR